MQNKLYHLSFNTTKNGFVKTTEPFGLKKPKDKSHLPNGWNLIISPYVIPKIDMAEVAKRER